MNKKSKILKKIIVIIFIFIVVSSILLFVLFMLSIKFGDFTNFKTPEDYFILLPNNYSYSCSSSDNCIISLECYSKDEAFLPEKIIELGWNKKYVIAKQYGMKLKYPNYPENTVTIPDDTKVYYWILDTEEKIRYGPYNNIKDFNKKKKEFNIENLSLKPVNQYKKTTKIKFGVNYSLFESYALGYSYMAEDISIGEYNTIVDYVIKYRKLKKNDFVYLISRKEKDSKELRYTIINYETKKYKIYESFNDLSEADKKIFKEKSKFKNTEI